MPDNQPAFPMFGELSRPDRRAATLGESGFERRKAEAYFTEPWVTRALLAAVDFHLPDLPDRVGETLWEPACGDGRMATVLAGAGYRVVAADLLDWGYGATGRDFLDPETPTIPCAAIVTNPPFTAARKFIIRAVHLTAAMRGKVAMVQRHEFDAPKINHPLFTDLPFAAKLILPRRPKWVDQVTKGNESGARFPFAWYLWDHRHKGPPMIDWLRDERS